MSRRRLLTDKRLATKDFSCHKCDRRRYRGRSINCMSNKKGRKKGRNSTPKKKISDRRRGPLRIGIGTVTSVTLKRVKGIEWGKGERNDGTVMRRNHPHRRAVLA